MIKKNIKVIVSLFVFCLFLFISFIYFYDFKQRVSKIQINHWGVNNTSIQYDIKSDRLNCKVVSSLDNIENGDLVELECKDQTFNFLKEKYEYEINNLLYKDSSSTEFHSLIKPIVATNEYYLKEEGDGISLIVIKNKLNNYELIIYSHLFYKDEKLYQVEDILDENSYQTNIEAGIITENIDSKYIDLLIEKYESDGYTKADE